MILKYVQHFMLDYLCTFFGYRAIFKLKRSRFVLFENRISLP